MAADDRTGALETAAALADRGANGGAGVRVSVWPQGVPEPDEVSVTDLVSRHLDPEQAAERATSLPRMQIPVHKIDSTLRGNWAAEVVARHHATGSPVLMVPALPLLGRTCVNGLVCAHGVAVAELDDPRGRPFSSRPAKHLAAAGVTAHAARSCFEVEQWLAEPSGIAVADAATSDDVQDIVLAWARATDVLLAGTSEVIARGFSSVHGFDRVRPPRFELRPPVLLVVGSVNPVARRQADVVAAVDRPDVTLLVTPSPTDGPVTEADATAAAEKLADDVRAVTQRQEVGTIVVVGGDTAAALLGTATVCVHGSVAPGTAWIESPDFEQPIVTRAGGFGDERALLDLVAGAVPT